MIYIKFLNNKRQPELNILMSKYHVVKMPRVYFARITKNNASIYSLVFDENVVDVHGENTNHMFEHYKESKEEQGKLENQFSVISFQEGDVIEEEMTNNSFILEQDKNNETNNSLSQDQIQDNIENLNEEKKDEKIRLSLEEMEMKLESYFRDNDNVQRLYQEDIDALHEALLRNDPEEEKTSSYLTEEDEEEKTETKRFVSRTKPKSRSKIRRK